MVALFGAVTACDMDLTKINENPNNPEVVPTSAVLSSGIWDLVSNNGSRGLFGVWTSLYHTTVWSQHLTQSAYNDESKYTPRAGINQNIWNEMYAGPLTDLKEAQKIGIDTGDDNLVAVTDILLVYGFLFLTDLFGDVPYFQALNLEEYSSPEFDPQSEIYPDLLQRLAVAAGKISTSGAAPSWASGDLIYGGNMARWQRFANSLRLRIAMRISGTAASTQASQAFSQAWSANRFASNADNAKLAWTGNLPSVNPIHKQLVLGNREGDFRISETLVDILGSRNDPRLTIFAAPAASDGVMRGLEVGSEPPDLGKTSIDFATLAPAFLAANAPSVMMTYSEVLLLGAEAAARGWIAADAETLYKQGIAASMQEHGVAQAAIDAYLAQPSVAYTGLAAIQTQKWITLFMNGPEAFAEVRRTGVPNLPLPKNAVINQLPTRMPYPANEGLYNPNFEPYKTVTYTQPLWWM